MGEDATSGLAVAVGELLHFSSWWQLRQAGAEAPDLP